MCTGAGATPAAPLPLAVVGPTGLPLHPSMVSQLVLLPGDEVVDDSAFPPGVCLSLGWRGVGLRGKGEGKERPGAFVSHSWFRPGL